MGRRLRLSLIPAAIIGVMQVAIFVMDIVQEARLEFCVTPGLTAVNLRLRFGEREITVLFLQP
jgi:hypothetical protein